MEEFEYQNDTSVQEDGTYRYVPVQPEPAYVPPVESVKKKKKN